eukprot:Skav204343  [mRNA]  locus=scaffold3936:42183:44096:- [translate_table: standard]
MKPCKQSHDLMKKCPANFASPTHSRAIPETRSTVAPRSTTWRWGNEAPWLIERRQTDIGQALRETCE